MDPKYEHNILNRIKNELTMSTKIVESICTQSKQMFIYPNILNPTMTVWRNLGKNETNLGPTTLMVFCYFQLKEWEKFFQEDISDQDLTAVF